MARPKRTALLKPTISRTLERVGIAALAAIATSGSSKGVAVSALTIFIIVVVVEELGRRWIWQGKSVTLRDVALRSIGELRLQRAGARARHNRRRRRSRSRSVGSASAVGSGDKGKGAIQE